VTKNGVYLIGINHCDFEGEGRLMKALQYLKPDLITMESTPDIEMPEIAEQEVNCSINALKDYLEQNGYTGDMGQMAGLARTIITNESYEYRIAMRFAGISGKQVYGLEDPKARSDAVISTGKELGCQLAKMVMGTGSKKNFQEITDSDYCRMREWYDSRTCIEDLNIPSGHIELIGNRDRSMSERFKSITDRESSSTVAHIGGMNHYLDSREFNTLYSLLKADFNPERILLNEF